MFSDNSYIDLNSLGYLAPLVAFILGTLQAIFPYIPFVVLAGTNGLVFGFYFGLLISFSSALSGALLSFWLARKWGQAWVLSRFGEKYKKQIEQFSSAYGFRTVLVARLVPVIPAPLLNLLSGVSKIGLKDFITASAIGMFPIAVLYTLVGNQITRVDNLDYLVTIVLVVVVGYYLIRFWFQQREHRKGLG